MRRINPYVRKTLYVLSLVLLVGLLFFLRSDQQGQTCQEIIVEIDAEVEKQLVTERLINNRISGWYTGGLLGTTRAELSLEKIERKIESMPAVKNAEVSFDLRGTLHIAIEQRNPLVRIIPLYGDSYYLAKGMKKIPVAGTDVARVPICNGRLTNAMITKVYTLSTYVHENAFMKALTEQIFVDNNGDLVIIPKVKNQRLIIGDTTELEAKFSKLIDFYSEGLNHIGWDKYKIINLKYKDQIVCR